MKIARVLLVAAVLAACSPKPAEEAEVAVPLGPAETSALTAASGNATAETGDITITTTAGTLSQAPGLRITTAGGKIYELAFVSEPAPLEELARNLTWNSLLNPSLNEPVRLYQVTTATDGDGFCKPGSVSYLAVARRVEEGGNQVRIAGFDDSAAPSAEAPQAPCSSFVYTEASVGPAVDAPAAAAPAAAETPAQ